MSRSTKRRRTGEYFIGAPSEADNPSAVFTAGSSSEPSTRALAVTTVPPLTTICARIFSQNYLRLRNNPIAWERASRWLRVIPNHLSEKIFTILTSTCPTYLQHEIIATYFIRGPSISLSKDITGVNKQTILAIPRYAASVRSLILSGLDKISDETFAAVLPKLPLLHVLVLRGCTKVGQKTITAAQPCTHLQVVNLNYTSPTPASVAALVVTCKSIQVLKLAGMVSWSPASFSKFIAGLDGITELTQLQTLKLKRTPFLEASLHSLTSLCPQLQRLDLSSTSFVNPPLQNAVTPKLVKLSLNFTNITRSSLLGLVSPLSQLKNLSIAALGLHQGSISSLMTDDTLRELTAILENCNGLESVNLLGNKHLGMSSKGGSALWSFINRVGRKCKLLNLAAIPSLRSFDLSGLLSEEGDQIPLVTLILNKTGIDDDAAPFIGRCCDLGMLDVASTRLTKDGLLQIVDTCAKLEILDLSSCRGVNVGDRRHFFQAWEQERNTPS
ncbi:RNI-like protein [Mycena floridula]|nr:RNI-like protein [Mycena floridula]